MKNTLKLLPTILFVLVFLYCALAYSSEIALAVSNGIEICLKTVIPSLFPFFIISSLVIDTGLASALGMRLRFVMPLLFKTNKLGITPLILGLIGGYPIGASCVISMYKNRLCSKRECEHMLSFCNNSGPGFIISAVGTGLLGSTQLGIFLYAIHVISSITVGIIMRFFTTGKIGENKDYISTCTTCSFPFAFTHAVKKSIFSCVNVCAFVISFGMVIKALSCTGTLSFVSSLFASVLPISSGLISKVLMGLCEVTNGVIGIAGYTNSLPSKLIIISALLGWGGLSVHFQTMAIIGDTKLSVKKYFIGKTLQSILSALLSATALKYFVFYDSQLVIPSFSTEKSLNSLLSADLITSATGALLLLIIFMFIFFHYIFQNCWKRKEK